MEPSKNKKIISKVPSYHQKPSFNEIYIKANRPLPVYFKHAQKVFNKHDLLIIHGLTAAINKVVSLTLQLMHEYPYLQQEVFTDSVPTVGYDENGERIVR